MKAKEYLEKYGPQLSYSDFKEFDPAAQSFMLDLYQEFVSLMKIRNITLDSSAVSLIEEINKKGNVVLSKLEKSYLQKDFFKKTLCSSFPEIASAFKIQEKMKGRWIENDY